MWTPASRGRMATIEKKTKRYPSDLTDEEWARIEPFLPRASKSGRPVEVDLREVLNAIRYMARSGGGWRMLPNDFPPWQTVYWWFRRFVRRFLFQTIHDVALMLDRERVGREASPTGGVIDSQSVKAPEAKTRGYDAGKKIVGRKRHIAVDTDGTTSRRWAKAENPSAASASRRRSGPGTGSRSTPRAGPSQPAAHTLPDQA